MINATKARSMNKHFKCKHDIIMESLEREILQAAPDSYNCIVKLNSGAPESLKKSISRSLMNLNYSFTWTGQTDPPNGVVYLRVDWGP